MTSGSGPRNPALHRGAIEPRPRARDRQRHSVRARHLRRRQYRLPATAARVLAPRERTRHLPVRARRYAVAVLSPGTMTTPGLFSGYDFGVINSRRKRSALAIKLSELGQYRHLIWLTDGQGARFLDPQDPIQGETSLHYTELGPAIQQPRRVREAGRQAVGSRREVSLWRASCPGTTTPTTSRRRRSRTSPGRIASSTPGG